MNDQWLIVNCQRLASLCRLVVCYNLIMNIRCDKR